MVALLNIFDRLQENLVNRKYVKLIVLKIRCPRDDYFIISIADQMIITVK